MNPAIAGFMINIQNSTVFLYICNEQSKHESKKTIPFAIASKIIKHLE